MATIAAPVAAPALAPKGFIAKFKERTAAQVAAVVLAPADLPDDAPIRARDIRLSADDGIALSSATYTATTFAKAVAHRLALFAGGQTLERVQEGLPTMAQCAIVAGAAGLKMGAGTDVRTLRLALDVGLSHVLALPVRTPKAKAAPVSVSSPTAALTAAAALPLHLVVERADGRDMRAPVPHGLTAAEAADAAQALVDIPVTIAAREAAAAAEAERVEAERVEAERKAEADRKADAMRQVMASMTKAGEEARIRAHAFAQLANELGIKLTPTQLKALDALEGIKRAA